MLKQNWVKIFIALVIVLLVVSAVLRAIAPPVVKIPQSQDFTQKNLYGTKTTFQNITYTGTEFKVPTQLSIAQFTPMALTGDKLATQFETDFNLTALGIPANTWAGTSYSFSLAEGSGHNVLNKDDAFPSAQIVNKDQAIQTAQTFLQKYIPGNTLQVISDKINYYADSPEPAVTDASKSNLVFLPFSYVIDGYPVFYQNQRDYPFEFLVDPENNIHKFSYYPFFIQISPGQKQNTISIAQAVTNINAGKASLISMDADDTSVTDISQITSAKLNAVSIEYRTDSQSGYVYPFFRFLGTATNGKNESFQVEIITPAIQTTSQQ